MSILIPGMKMPNDCPMCPMSYWNAGGSFSGCRAVAGKKFAMDDDGYRNSNKRPDWCPLIELPPHGRLGDLDALMAEFERMQTLYERRGHEFACSFMSSSMEISTEWYCVEDAVNAAKTIIPADPKKEDT